MRIAALCTAVLLLAAGGGQPAASFVPVGVWYGGGTAQPPIAPRDPPLEPEAWRADLETIRALGFNSVTTWVDWAGAEPRPGEYRFDALDRLLMLAGKAGLRVVVQLYPGVAPDWLARHHPDAFPRRLERESTAAAASQYCFDHPEVRARVQAFVAAVSRRAATHASFYALDVGAGTPGFAEPDDGAALCPCPHSRKRLADWLQRKYGTLEALNAAWGRTFAAWEDVSVAAKDTSPAGAAAIDIAQFAAVKQQEDLRFLAEASAPRGARPTSAHAITPAVVRGLFTAMPGADDWWMGSSVDYVGAAVLPGIPGREWRPMMLPAALDGMRSAAGGRAWWAARVQAGQGIDGARVGAPVTAADVRLWGWAAIARGARALSFFTWYPMRSGSSAHGYGLVDLDGRLTDRARAAGALASIVSRNPALFAPLRPHRSQIAVVYEPLASTATDARAHAQSMAGFYRALFERNIQVDFVHAGEIAAGAASGYRALVLPSPLLLRRGVPRALAAYVEAGGTLISEGRPGWLDDRGEASPRVPGLGLDDLFGVREKALQPGPEVELRMVDELDGSLSSFAGRTIRLGGPAEHFEISGTNVRVIARFPRADGAPGEPAIVLSRHGKGRAILIGGNPAAAFDEDPAAFRATGDLLAALVAGAGVAPDVRVSGGDGLVETRYLESSDALVIVFINHDHRPHRVTFTFPPDTPEAIWLNLETGTSVHFVAGADGPTWTHAFGARDVVALMIRNEYR